MAALFDLVVSVPGLPDQRLPWLPSVVAIVLSCYAIVMGRRQRAKWDEIRRKIMRETQSQNHARAGLKED